VGHDTTLRAGTDTVTSETRVPLVSGASQDGRVTDTSAAQGMRGFWNDLPPAGRWLLSTTAIQTLGRGLTLPFTIIYLHEVRGTSHDLAGTLMAFIAVVALAVTGPGGALTDRIGARRILLMGTTAQLVGCVILAFATTPPVVALSFLLLGFNFGVSWPASTR
jgi:MFS family permease